MVFDPGSPLEAIRVQFPHASVGFDDGSDPARAAEEASKVDAVVVFVDQYMTESADAQKTSACLANKISLVEAVTQSESVHRGGP